MEMNVQGTDTGIVYPEAIREAAEQMDKIRNYGKDPSRWGMTISPVWFNDFFFTWMIYAEYGTKSFPRLEIRYIGRDNEWLFMFKNTQDKWRFGWKYLKKLEEFIHAAGGLDFVAKRKIFPKLKKYFDAEGPQGQRILNAVRIEALKSTVDKREESV